MLDYKVLYDYDAQGADEVSVKQGDDVHVVQKDNADWWTIQTSDNQQGLAPSNYLEKLEGNGGPSDGPVLARVIQEYEAQDSQQISLWKNGIVTVLEQNIGDGWWKGDLNGKTGLFPLTHVKVIEAKEEPVEEDKTKRQSFKLAAYGVKQGGIGSILSGGILRKKTAPKKEESPAPQPEASKSPEVKSTPSPSEQHAIVLNAYTPQNDDELTLLAGAYITITDKMDDSGWWKGCNEKNEEGVFPSNFVQLIPSSAMAPIRPQRARPPTIKTDAVPPPSAASSVSPTSVASPTSMAKPPPVPVSTRPTSLKSAPLRRPPTNPEVQSTPLVAPPRPITSPPVPVTSPSVPSRPSLSLHSDPISPPARPHKRTPSIPMTSPDLPPPTNTSQEHHHPTRPSRPIPVPGPTSSPSAASHVSPTHEMAKPPKVIGYHVARTGNNPSRSLPHVSILVSTPNHSHWQDPHRCQPHLLGPPASTNQLHPALQNDPCLLCPPVSRRKKKSPQLPLLLPHLPALRLWMLAIHWKPSCINGLTML
ncbi:hypothetical protein DM01DRAFT_1073510 [Hesseltinella vesiculosa]|uniref:SH3 domain-containing protein n=1 Tax=Hesseltinella vesiculosa TaxID=101127 RepID=A0A1X2GVV2_9FUNG|nr:hypothetical protein DM01DRAFT_1073510 [Hesseltinella vesiculosa]